MLEQYIDFFAAACGASAGLVGLLFIALSVDTDLTKEAHIRQFTLTETAFIALGGIFVISLFALLPSGLSLMAATGIFLSVVGIWSLLRRKHRFAANVFLPVDSWYIFVTVGVYIFFGVASIWILITNGTIGLLNVFCVLIVILFVLSLLRAWRALLITQQQAAHRRADKIVE